MTEACIDFYVAELPYAHGTSILGMNLNCLYTGPRAWTQVTRVWGEAATHFTNSVVTFLQFTY